jgi:hypothetical protein
VSTVEVKEAISKAEVWVNDYNFGIKVVQEEVRLDDRARQH